MKGLVYRGPHDVAVLDVPVPVLPDEFGAVVEVTTASICGTDLHLYRGAGFSSDVGFCVGHEAVGRVSAVGARVTSFAAGDRVLIPGSVGCSRCRQCRLGLVARCAYNTDWRKACYGLHAGLPGSQAEFVAVPHAETNLVTIPDAVSDEVAILLTDAAPTAWYAARRARIAYGDTVVVLGLGPVGLMSVQASLLMGAARVIGVDTVADRCARAATLGAEPLALEPGDDARSLIRAATDGDGPDAIVEAVGSDVTINLAIRTARLGGRVSVVGVSHSTGFPLNLERAQIKELEFAIGLCSVQYELPTLIPLASAGRLRADAVLSHTFPLSQASEAYRMFADRSDGACKILLDPSR